MPYCLCCDLLRNGIPRSVMRLLSPTSKVDRIMVGAANPPHFLVFDTESFKPL